MGKETIFPLREFIKLMQFISLSLSSISFPILCPGVHFIQSTFVGEFVAIWLHDLKYVLSIVQREKNGTLSFTEPQ